MPIPTDFPHDLLGAPLLGKKRDTMQLYDTRQNFDGKNLNRQVRDNSTVYFDISFLVPTIKLPLMAMWLETKNKGQTFNITLKSEGGDNTYNAQWVEIPLSPRESQGGYTYSGVIYAEQLLQGWEGATDEELDDFWDFIAEGGANPLAITVNENWPS